ncbi:MAG: bifunctional homocysteine S-methyltransferase/methylenetetrahydrofolate reductase [Myxococcales bacterium]|nr:bifunctional homocysteine S-methyltransferase/methylenetetrahydrofolate reductase [Myxococcales bacterium]
MKGFLDLARHGGLLFDGAMGSLLYERGVFLTNSFEAVNLTQPELVRQIHQEYLQAGARVLTTNTFGANRVRLEKHGLADKVQAINEAGVKLALEVSGGGAFVAGSIGPTGLTLEELVGAQGARAEDALAEQIELLDQAGADVICLETFYHLAELELAVRLARARTPKPIVALYTFQQDGLALGGLSPEQVGRRLIEAGADVIGANCGGGPDLLFRVTTPMVPLGLPVIAQANAGRPEVIEGRVIYVANPEYFGVFARRLLKAGVKVIGGCCGTGPEHIRRMAGAARMFAADSDGAPQPRIADGGLMGATSVGLEIPLAERSDLGARLSRGDFVTSVELNPPVGFDLRKRVDAAIALRDIGVTTINIADGPRASLRMTNLAMAVEVARETGLSPLLHVCCRDRNFLGLQAHLLGAHVLGLRNLVVITGDPPKMGDYPNATAVYDVDSIGLLNIITGYNSGVDPAGKAMPEKTRFVKLTGAEPAALNYDRELRRLEMKRDAGADAVMTQPVYDPRVAERFLDDVRGLGLPILLGVVPLASHRNALFIDKNIPGMRVPGYVLERMAQADEKGRGQEEGIQIARESLLAFRDRIQGAYIMPPFDRHAAAMRVLEGFVTAP